MTRIFYFLLVLVAFSACKNNTRKAENTPIVLGDSSTIVTEREAKYLKDFDLDDIAAPNQTDGALTKTNTIAPSNQQSTALPAKGGQTVQFSTVKLVFEGLSFSEPKQQNPEKDNGLTYTTNSENLSKYSINISGTKQVRIRQRYQSQLTLITSLGNIVLSELGLYTSDWVTIGENSGSMPLSSLANLTFDNVNNAKIKNALEQTLRKQRSSNKTILSWIQEIKNTKTAQDKPCTIALQNVQWQISGTDNKGVNFHKNIRLEINK